MLENLLNLVKQQAGSSIINNPAIPNEKNDEAVAVAGQSITGGLQQLLSQGGIKDVLSMFSGKQEIDSSNPAVQQVSGNVVQNLMDKLGLDQQQAGSVAGGLVPDVLKKLVSKTNDPNDNSFDIQSIFNSLSGGGTSGVNVQGLLNKFKGGLDQDGDGDVDLQDLTAAFSGKGGGGGVMDKLKGLFN
jgi:uncharacterized protein YidB (DUF937 family)